MTTTAPRVSDDVRIRRAEKADLLAVHRIEQASFPQPWPFTTFEQFLGSPGFLVAVDGGIVGFVVADVAETPVKPIGHIKDLAVHENRRREGIASSLLESALAVLDGDLDVVKLEVRESNEDALALYREYEFEYRRTVPGYYGNGEDALVLVREL